MPLTTIHQKNSKHLYLQPLKIVIHRFLMKPGAINDAFFNSDDKMHHKIYKIL